MLRAHSELMVARQLAGFADALDVRSPAGCAPASGRHRPRARARQPADGGAAGVSAGRGRLFQHVPAARSRSSLCRRRRSAGGWPGAARPSAPGARARARRPGSRASVQRDTKRSSPSSRTRREDGQGRRDDEVDTVEHPLEGGLPLALGLPRGAHDARRRRRPRAQARPHAVADALGVLVRPAHGPSAMPRRRGGGRPGSAASSHPGMARSSQVQPARRSGAVDGGGDGRVGLDGRAAPRQVVTCTGGGRGRIPARAAACR